MVKVKKIGSQNLIISSLFINHVNSSTYGTKMPRASWGFIGNSCISYPTLLEQQQIVAYIEEKTSKIDKLIENYQKLIELSKEKRTALITHCVTKGLDPTVKMKDSGIEWLGEVPEHWDNAQLKYCCLINPKKSEVSRFEKLTCSFISMEKLKTDSLILDQTTLVDDVFDGYNYFRDGDILMAKVTPCFENKNIAIAQNLYNGIGFGSSEIYTLRAYEHISKRFLFYRLQESVLMNMAISEMTGAGGLKRVPQKYLSGYIIATPSIAEQTTIANYLDQQTAKIDQTIDKAQQAIELLKEKRTALITAAVTGKIDVREHA